MPYFYLFVFLRNKNEAAKLPEKTMLNNVILFGEITVFLKKLIFH